MFLFYPNVSEQASLSVAPVADRSWFLQRNIWFLMTKTPDEIEFRAISINFRRRFHVADPGFVLRRCHLLGIEESPIETGLSISRLPASNIYVNICLIRVYIKPRRSLWSSLVVLIVDGVPVKKMSILRYVMVVVILLKKNLIDSLWQERNN